MWDKNSFLAGAIGLIRTGSLTGTSAGRGVAGLEPRDPFDLEVPAGFLAAWDFAFPLPRAVVFAVDGDFFLALALSGILNMSSLDKGLSLKSSVFLSRHPGFDKSGSNLNNPGTEGWATTDPDQGRKNHPAERTPGGGLFRIANEGVDIVSVELVSAPKGFQLD